MRVCVPFDMWIYEQNAAAIGGAIGGTFLLIVLIVAIIVVVVRKRNANANTAQTIGAATCSCMLRFGSVLNVVGPCARYAGHKSTSSTVTPISMSQRHYSSPHDVRVEPPYEQYMGAAEFDAMNRDMVSARIESSRYAGATQQTTSRYNDPAVLMMPGPMYDASQWVTKMAQLQSPTAQHHYTDATTLPVNVPYDQSQWIRDPRELVAPPPPSS